ncbi:hypothetical protein [Bathymodiolus thermophilus thioautotrophic gill symbiont]|uniref:Uncharacterized protein n=1 Tax=Bathymodiolus thermophilus thioautotrophic gill symbiont TaxID=2360 RepID=A0A8H8XD53_9GAMM|nr:hypothetical protein [Bathymodiolus thermophilus thioautotrophic gill symbiont]CAB5497465.1 hypothetical protein THERMOS_678 [Bathymodiolus thermophilus thioautotrophic gill symbiont]
MASGYLDLAYFIEISIVFNLAYREIKHGTVLKKMKQIREKMSKDEELQERIKEIKKEDSLGSKVVESSYMKLTAIIECDVNKPKDCSDKNSKLYEAWSHNKNYCRYFVNTILTGQGLRQVNASIGVALIILFFATISPHIGIEEPSPYIWWPLFTFLVVTIFIPIRLLYMSEKVGNMLIGGNSQKGLIEKLEEEFNADYNQYLKEKAKNSPVPDTN